MSKVDYRNVLPIDFSLISRISTFKSESEKEILTRGVWCFSYHRPHLFCFLF